MKKSGFADWNTRTFTDGSASRSVIRAPNSTIVVGTNMLIGGLLKVIVHRPGWVRSVLNCEGSGMAHLLRRLADQLWIQADLGHGSCRNVNEDTFIGGMIACRAVGIARFPIEVPAPQIVHSTTPFSVHQQLSYKASMFLVIIPPIRSR